MGDWKKSALRVLLPLLASLAAVHSWAEMPRIDLAVGFYRVDAEVAANPADRRLGLMNRRNMAANHGMLFVFTQADRHCMWMRNTLLPLAVAFIDRDGRILNIEEMQPNTDDSHCASAPATFALEMNRRWFSDKGFKPGTMIHGLDSAPLAH